MHFGLDHVIRGRDTCLVYLSKRRKIRSDAAVSLVNKIFDCFVSCFFYVSFSLF